jgi:PEP-CTERM motif
MNQRTVRRTLAALLLAGTGAQASVTVFNDEAAFVAATAATWASLPAPAIGAPIVPSTDAGPLHITARLAVFNAADPYCGPLCLDGIAATLSEPMLGISGEEDFVVTTKPAATQLYAFGLGIYEPKLVTVGDDTPSVICGGGTAVACEESRFRFRLYDGADELGLFDYLPVNDAWTFWGVQSTLPFNKVTVSEIAGNDENELFARFHYATSYHQPPGGSAPEPSTLALVTLAGVVAALRTRRR